MQLTFVSTKNFIQDSLKPTTPTQTKKPKKQSSSSSSSSESDEEKKPPITTPTISKPKQTLKVNKGQVYYTCT